MSNSLVKLLVYPPISDRDTDIEAVAAVSESVSSTGLKY